jgi:hypothetical protein
MNKVDFATLFVLFAHKQRVVSTPHGLLVPRHITTTPQMAPNKNSAEVA